MVGWLVGWFFHESSGTVFFFKWGVKGIPLNYFKGNGGGGCEGGRGGRGVVVVGYNMKLEGGWGKKGKREFP